MKRSDDVHAECSRTRIGVHEPIEATEITCERVRLRQSKAFPYRIATMKRRTRRLSVEIRVSAVGIRVGTVSVGISAIEIGVGAVRIAIAVDTIGIAVCVAGFGRI